MDAPIGFVDDASWRGWGVTPDGKSAVTRFDLLSRTDGFAALGCTLETGRTHQIRVHLKHLGLSLVGEEWYRDPPCPLHARQALHAESVRFTDGLEPAAFVAPLPPDLVDLPRGLGLDVAAMTQSA